MIPWKGCPLFNEPPMLIPRSVAVAVGLNEAIVLQQFHYWLGKVRNVRDGKRWVYNSYPKWRKQFPFWSERTVERIITKLEKDELLISAIFNRDGRDRTKWYTIDYDKLVAVYEAAMAKFEADPSRQIGAMDDDDLSGPLPEEYDYIDYPDTLPQPKILAEGNGRYLAR